MGQRASTDNGSTQPSLSHGVVGVGVGVGVGMLLHWRGELRGEGARANNYEFVHTPTNSFSR